VISARLYFHRFYLISEVDATVTCTPHRTGYLGFPGTATLDIVAIGSQIRACSACWLSIYWLMVWTIYLFVRFINRGDCLKPTVMGRNPEGDVVIERVGERSGKPLTRGVVYAIDKHNIL
jgi:hypothetical protein